ncbi:MAG: hypothetical protein WA737_00185, partial [Candidatus Acidiferrales bacterium]
VRASRDDLFLSRVNPRPTKPKARASVAEASFGWGKRRQAAALQIGLGEFVRGDREREEYL